MLTTDFLHAWPLGPFATNCYVVTSRADAGKEGAECWIIDPGFDPRRVIAFLRERTLRPTHILLTHAHADHIGGVRDVLECFPNLPIALHEAEHEWLSNPALNLSASMGLPITTPPASLTLRDGDVLSLGEDRWEVRHTPGHSPGSVSFVLKDADPPVAIVGDALFAGSIGRTDFPTSNHHQLVESIRSKLYVLPDATLVHAGHGPGTTIGREARSNPFVRRS